MQTLQPTERQESFDEFSPAKMIQRAKGVLAYLKRTRWWTLSIAILLGSVGAIVALNKETKYKAELSFAIDEEKTQHNRSEFSEFSEQLGLAPIDGGNVFSSSKNINELLKSRLLIEKTLRSKVTAYKKNLLFIDFLLDSLNYREKWTKNNPNPRPDFDNRKKDSTQVLFENGLLKNAYKAILSDMLKVSEKGKGTTITSVTLESEHPAFSKYFLEALIEKVIQYYIDSKTERSRINLAIIEKRTDSIKQAYVGALYGKASFRDADINLVRETFSVPGEKKQTDVQILRTSYIELSRNLELAKTSLMNNTPTIQILDTPILPLDTSKPSALKQFLLFFLLGIVVGVMFFIGLYLLKKLRTILRSNNNEPEPEIYQPTEFD